MACGMWHRHGVIAVSRCVGFFFLSPGCCCCLLRTHRGFGFLFRLDVPGLLLRTGPVAHIIAPPSTSASTTRHLPKCCPANFFFGTLHCFVCASSFHCPSAVGTYSSEYVPKVRSENRLISYQLTIRRLLLRKKIFPSPALLCSPC
ncbi:hypothetical protein B0T10DRAFT_173051 [Thelonectria olida]|uniref:Uncharacterized protein n=1 Tax=Thelonectria olida TaxID=1576542 RepID=A0A9P8WDP3_9HYPO|nr:hypothetical protein B0T10DRAFT_173051 [Thelonectria olida]